MTNHLPEPIRDTTDGAIMEPYMNIELSLAERMMKDKLDHQHILTYFRLRDTYRYSGANFKKNWNDIAAVTHRSTKTARKHIKGLVEKGWIRDVNSTHFQFVSMYRFSESDKCRVSVFKVSCRFIQNCSLRQFRAVLVEAITNKKNKTSQFMAWKNANGIKDIEKGKYYGKDGNRIRKITKPKLLFFKVQQETACRYQSLFTDYHPSTHSRYQKCTGLNNYQRQQMQVFDKKDWGMVTALNENAIDQGISGGYFTVGPWVYTEKPQLRTVSMSLSYSRCGGRFR